MSESHRFTICAALSVVLALGACSRPADTTSTKTPQRIGRIDAIDGAAVIVHGEQRIAATVGFPVFAGDRLETGAIGKVQVTLVDNTVVAIGADSKVDMAELVMDGTSRIGRIAVAAGQFWVRITKWTKGESRYEIATPSAVAGVRGTTLWGSTDVDAICALEGTIEVRSLEDASLAPASLSAGSCASELSKGKLAPLVPPKETIDGYLKDVLIPSAPR